jgi:DNA repair exonuclease SbcCD ATPase subunit
MIKFEIVRFKNFGSFGNTITEIALDKNKTTLICGNNGSGKSFAFLDSITFALFGKPFRKINIPQLVNSINEKGCLVEIEFTRGSDKFLVRRGLQPKIFEIHKNGVLIPQDAKSLDYQDVLEQQILKMNYKTFTQVVILGSSSFVPFMQLSAADRRSVIENILDINIFSTMNIVLKGKILTVKEAIKNLNTKMEIEKNKIITQKSYISTLLLKNNEDIGDKEDQITHLKNKIAELEFDHLNSFVHLHADDLTNALAHLKTQTDRVKKLNTNKSLCEANIQQKDKEIKFFRDNQVCPTCAQSISDKLKKEKIIDINMSISDLGETIENCNEEISISDKTIETFESNIAKLRTNITEASSSRKEIDAYRSELERIEKTIKKSVLTTSIAAEEDTLNQLQGGLTTLESEKVAHGNDLSYHELANELLRDGGVKAKIIKYYLPHMNKHINKFLSAMDFFVQFDLDEEFNEHIKSRHRDEFSYMNFSEGEKMRIDLALLLSWREIARAKNSVHCNLLILDEIFDSSLDGGGMDEIMKLIKVIGDKANVYVISHKSDQLVDRFSTTISFEKKNNFSRMINT